MKSSTDVSVMKRPQASWAAKVVLMAAVLGGMLGVVQPAITPAVAHAAVFQGPDKLGWGRAAVLFNRDETFSIGTGGLINIPPSNPAVAAFYAVKGTLAVIALQYYNRGLCSAYLWSARPWDNQGFMSRKC